MPLMKKTNKPRVIHDLFAELPEKKGITLLGAQISSCEDLALLGEIYRSPRYETFHYLFTRKNKVVGVTAISLRLVNEAIVFTGENKNSFFDELINRSSTVNADCVYFLHNHPSGDPTPSGRDLETTKKLVDDIFQESSLQFGGHVVINSTQYSVIQADGSYETLPIKHSSYNIAQMRQRHSFFGTKIRQPDDLASCAKILQKSEDSFLAVGLNTKNECNCIFEIGYDIFDLSQKRLQVTVRKWADASGVKKIGLVNFSIDKLSGNRKVILQNMEKSGLILDIITDDGFSLQSTAAFISKETVNRKKKTYEINEYEGEYFQPELNFELIKAYQRASSALERLKDSQKGTASIVNEILQEKECLSQAMHGMCNESKIWNHDKSTWIDENAVPPLFLSNDSIKADYIKHLIKKYTVKILSNPNVTTSPEIKI
jgi:hypothetical protein